MSEVKYFKGVSNKLEMTVHFKEGRRVKPFPFVDKVTSKIALYFAGIIFDSDSVTMAFDNNGNVEVYLDDTVLNIPQGTYDAELVCYDGERPEGRMLVHPEKKNSNLQIKVIKSAVASA